MERVGKMTDPLAALVEAAQAVLERWDLLLPRILVIDALAANHGYKYDGPPEGLAGPMDAMRATLRLARGESA